MECFEEIIKEPKDALDNSMLALDSGNKTTCFFDIETTGLSPKVSSVYLIGAAWHDGTDFRLKQWFAEDYISEKKILESFSEFLRPFDTIVHYNGTTFDIPYLEKKYAQHGLISPFEKMESLDLFTEIRRQKAWFNCQNRKLSTMEKLLGFCRRDSFTGKDCIEQYTNFMQKKIFRDETASEYKKNLLLHNHDDLIGTILCCQFLYYTRSHAGNTLPVFESSENILTIRSNIMGEFPLPFEKKISLSPSKKKTGEEKNPEEDLLAKAHFEKREISITVPLFKGTLCHFYSDYKNYYYLPIEDMAVHKSVGIYVDASRREKATAANCYTKKTGAFFPLPQKETFTSLPHFQKEKKNQVHYIEIETIEKMTEEQKRELIKLFIELSGQP